MALRILTFNIHKGFSVFNRRFRLPELRERIREQRADLVFIQEALGVAHPIDKRQMDVLTSQYEYLADGVWTSHAYGKNAVTEHAHHGNAILSRFPIRSWTNIDISTNSLEHRGLLIADIPMPEIGLDCVCACTHLDLFAAGRQKQYAKMRKYLSVETLGNRPLILAGDFNDWRAEADELLAKPLGLTDVFLANEGARVKTFPAAFPVLPLDRIYVRGIDVEKTFRWSGPEWKHLSDHIAISAELTTP